MRPTRVDIDQWAIDHGVQESATRCPGILAIQRAIPEAERVIVHVDGAVVLSHRGDDRRYEWPPNDELCLWLTEFDRDRQSVQPFSFTLDPADAVRVVPISHRRPQPSGGVHPATSGTTSQTAEPAAQPDDAPQEAASRSAAGTAPAGVLLLDQQAAPVSAREAEPAVGARVRAAPPRETRYTSHRPVLTH